MRWKSILHIWLLVLACLADFAAAADETFISVKTGKSMQQAMADLEQAVASHNYVVLRRFHVDAGLVPRTAENQEVVLVYFCNFAMLSQALAVDNRVGLFLPCRVTLIQRKDGVEMLALNPKTISKRLGDPRLDAICDQLTRDYKEILEEAAL